MQRVEFKDGTISEELFSAPKQEQLENKMNTRLREVANDHGGISTVRRKKIGRNDPCPCGSKIKFKNAVCTEAKKNSY